MRAFWSHSWRGPWKFVRSHIMLVKRMPRYLVPTEECTCIIMAGAKKIWLCLIKIRYPDLLDIQYQSFFQWRCGYGTVVTLTWDFSARILFCRCVSNTLGYSRVSDFRLYQLNGVIFEVVEENAFSQALFLHPLWAHLFSEVGPELEDLLLQLDPCWESWGSLPA